MWKFPGATRTVPGATESLSHASRTSMAHSLFSRSANDRVKPGGMCCTTSVAGLSAGMSVRTASIAFVPPVDAPIASTVCVVFSPSGAGGAGGRVHGPVHTPRDARHRGSANRAHEIAPDFRHRIRRPPASR